jgi:Zn-dependent membrane protease YugP
MHPVLILVPAAALILGPRLWVSHVLKQHNRKEGDIPVTAGELARELLDLHGLQQVKVESTDIGDHYDPKARAVRLTRDKIDRKTLTAVTTAAHEVAHAIQHASDYGPFVWRGRLVRIAQVAGEAGFILLISVPITAMASRRPVPPIVVGSAALAMLGTGVAAQLAALPSELDASFGRALPMLEENYINGNQIKDARKILTACSLTYIASSLVSILNIWPWLGRPAAASTPLISPGPAGSPIPASSSAGRTVKHPTATGSRKRPTRRRRRRQPGITAVLVRRLGKPLIREVLRYSRRHTRG